LPSGRPKLALLLEVVALLELLLSGVAPQKGVAMLVDPVAEVLTGHADAGSLPALELAVVNKIPFLHALTELVQLY